MIEFVVVDQADERCGVCRAVGTSYVLTRDERPTVALCADCVAEGRGASALAARERGRDLYQQADAVLAVARLIENADEWPVEEWGRD